MNGANSVSLLSGLLPVASFRPNRIHVGSARKAGVDLGASLAAFVTWHERQGSELTAPAWARAFGGWLKNNAAAAPRPKTPEELEKEELAAWKERLRTSGLQAHNAV